MNNDAMKEIIEKRHFSLCKALNDDPSAPALQAQRNSLNEIASFILEHIDPTKTGRFGPWLLEQYALGYFKLSHARKLKTLLRSFLAFEEAQPSRDRTSGLPRSWLQVSELLSSWSAQNAPKALAESRILYEKPDGLTIGVPRTEFAAEWWGMGTVWPPSRQEDNHFQSWNVQSPIIVLKFPDGRKALMMISDRLFKLVDEDGQPIDMAAIGADWPHLYAVIYAAAHLHPNILSLVPSELVDQSLIEAAVRTSYIAMRHVPPERWTPDLCALALSKAPGALRSLIIWAEDNYVDYVANDRTALHPRELFTLEQYKRALAENGDVLRCLPPNFWSEDLYRIAIACDGFAIFHLPKALRTDELYELAISQNGMVLQQIPHEKRSREWCQRAVTKDGRALSFVPGALHDEDLYLSAMRSDGRMLEVVPLKMRTREICEAAVMNRPVALRWVPEPYRSPELCLAAVMQQGEVLRWVPAHLRTPGLCLVAVTQDGLSLKDVPLASRSEELYQVALRQNGEALEFIAEVDRTRTLCEIALETSGSHCEHLIPKVLLSELVPQSEDEPDIGTQEQQELCWNEGFLDEFEMHLHSAPPPVETISPQPSATEPLLPRH